MEVNFRSLLGQPFQVMPTATFQLQHSLISLLNRWQNCGSERRDGLKVIKLMVAAKTVVRAPAPVDSPRLVSSTEKPGYQPK